MLNTKAKKMVRSIIRNHFGHCNLNEVRKYLKSKSVNEYGCFFYEENIGGGIKLAYTSNPNCFAEYLVSIKGVGFSTGYAITKNDITKAGKFRGCESHYAL